MGVRYHEVTKNGDQIHIRRSIDLKDGTIGVQSITMPPDVINIRAGEYGLDPVEDADAVWTIILNEIHLNPDDDNESPFTRHATIEEAREAHLATCQAEHDKFEARSGEDHGITEAESRKMLKKLKDMCPANRQLALLHGERIKHELREYHAQVEKRGSERRSPVTKMLDELREREDV